jgi:hypothetical protein
MSRPTLLFTDAERRPKTDSWFAGAARVLLIYVVTRVVVWTFAYTGSLIDFRIQHRLDRPMEKHEIRFRELAASQPDAPELTDFRRLMGDFAPLCRFDGDHYRSIVEGGYRYRPVTPEMSQQEREQNIAFFPLFPMLARPFAALFGSARAGMVFVAHACSLAGALLLYHWIRRRIDTNVAVFSAAAMLCLPQACYYSFGYAEGCTLLLTVLTMMLLDGALWLPAAVACGIATATRPTAAALVPVYAITYWFRSRQSESDAPSTRTPTSSAANSSPSIATDALAVAAPASSTPAAPSPTTAANRLKRLALYLPIAAAGLAAYAIFLTVKFGSPFVYFANFRAGWVPDKHRADWFEYLTLARVWDQFKHFGRALGGLPASLPEILNPFAWNMAINFFILFLSLAGMRRVPASFRPLLFLGPFIFLQAYAASGGATFGVQPISRYMAVSASAFVVLAAWCVREWSATARHSLLAAFVLLQAAWALRFGMGEWSS